MQAAENALNHLYQNISERGQGSHMPFRAFLDLAVRKPDVVFRDIFRVFHDMIRSYVGDGFDEYPDDPESINYVYYDCGKLFVEGSDHPFLRIDCLLTGSSILSVLSKGVYSRTEFIYSKGRTVAVKVPF